MIMKNRVWIVSLWSLFIKVVFCETIISLNEDAEDSKQIQLSHENITEDKNSTGKYGRLPQYLFPSKYQIRLQPFVNGNLTINGRIAIAFDVINSTDTIVLNMVDIMTKNETCKVELLNNTSVISPIIINQTYEAYNQQYIIQLSRNLSEGSSYKLSLDFVAYLNDKLVGFYLSTYEDSNGKEWRLASTQFSPTDARRAFPCFDEPLFKATFDIILVRQENMTAWSNMPIRETKQLAKGWVEDQFYKTPIMSTYLIGFLIADYISTESNFTNKTFNVLTRTEAINQTDYSLFFAPKCLQYFEEYFKIKYPLPKLDMAAIPDFKFNGMENWGLIMYREAAMLFDENVTTVAAKRSIAAVIAHEIAHQWFGNLVTPEWWSDLWLKEGFATYMGYSAADAVEPEWNMMEYIVYHSLHQAFNLDSFRSSHPINVEVVHPDRITQIFDTISYEKGASIIRMMQHFLTEDAYKRGMTLYLQELQFKNAKQEDLWHYLNIAWNTSLSQTIDLSVQNVMDSWTLKQGYPLVHVTLNGSEAVLRQEPFLLEGNLLHALNFNTSRYGIDPQCPQTLCNSSWWIPISYTSEKSANFSQTQPDLWMKPTDIQSTIKNVTEDSWLLINVQKTGFYRVTYDHQMWEKLAKQLQTNHTIIHQLNRAQLIDDSLSLARAGKLPYLTAVNILSYLNKENDLTPWTTFFNNVGYIYNRAKFEGVEEPLKTFLQELLANQYKLLGFEDKPGDSYSTQTLRGKISHWACKVGLPSCISAANHYFKLWLLGNEENSTNLRNSKPTMLCLGIRNSNETQWNETFEKYVKSNIQTEKVDILKALGCVNNTQILKRFVGMALNKTSGIRKQDSSTVFSTVSNTPAGRNITWNIIKEKWLFMPEYFGHGSSTLRYILYSATNSFAHKELLDELLEFTIKYKNDLASVKQTLDESFEEGMLNIAWKTQLLPELLSSVKKYSKSINEQDI